MSRLNIIRAWKDEEYRRSLSDEERKLLPENPAGLLELDEDALDSAAGAVGTICAGQRVTFGNRCQATRAGHFCINVSW